MKARIVKITSPSGRESYQIQERHLLYRWMWVNVFDYEHSGMLFEVNYETLEEAKKDLCYFDGTPYKEEVVHP